MNRRFMATVVVVLTCAAAAVSMYVVRLDVTALRKHAGDLGVGVSFSGLRPAVDGAVFTDAILHRAGTFDLYLVSPALRAARRETAWSLTAKDSVTHLFAPAFSLPSGLVHRAAFRFDDGYVGFDGAVAAPFFMIDTPRVHERPLTWKDLLFSFSGRVDKATATVTLDQGSVSKGDATIDVSGSWRAAFESRPMMLRFSSRALSGAQVRRLVPRVLTSRLGDVGFGGSLGFSLKLDAGAMPTDSVHVALAIDNQLSVTGFAEGFTTMPLASSFEWEAYDSGGGSISYESGPGSPAWCALDTLPPALPASVVELLDPQFLTHRGVSAHAIASLLESTINGTAPEDMTATISERFAATLWPLPGTGLRRRTELALLAIHLEDTLDKPRILALYLNTANYGSGLVGIRSAAQHLFGKTPDGLTASQCVLLALALAHPSRAVIQPDGQANPSAVPAAAEQLANLRKHGVITDEELKTTLDELRTSPASER